MFREGSRFDFDPSRPQNSLVCGCCPVNIVRFKGQHQDHRGEQHQLRATPQVSSGRMVAAFLLLKLLFPGCPRLARRGSPSRALLSMSHLTAAARRPLADTLD